MNKFIRIVIGLSLIVFCFMGCQKPIDNTQTENKKNNISLEFLRQQAENEKCSCAVAYLGNSKDIKAFVNSEECKKYKTKYDFINEIPNDRYIEFAGDEIYLIVPTEADTKMRVLEIPTDGTNNILSEKNFDTGEPILIRCNVSDIIPNSLIELTAKDGEKISVSPSLSLKDGKLWTGNETSVYDFTIYDDAMPSNYKSVLEEYYTAISENKGAEWYMQNNMNYLVADDFIGNAMENVGYAIIDLDNDGKEELIIGTTEKVTDEFYKKMILIIYSGNKEVLSSIERNRLYYAGDNKFANFASNSAFESIDTTLKYEDGELVDMTYTTNPKEYQQIDLIPLKDFNK